MLHSLRLWCTPGKSSQIPLPIGLPLQPWWTGNFRIFKPHTCQKASLVLRIHWIRGELDLYIVSAWPGCPLTACVTASLRLHGCHHVPPWAVVWGEGQQKTRNSPNESTQVRAPERNSFPGMGRLGMVWSVRDSRWSKTHSQEAGRWTGSRIIHKPRFQLLYYLTQFHLQNIKSKMTWLSVLRQESQVVTDH